MALLYFKDEKQGPGKHYMGKAAVRAILAKRDENYDRLHEMFMEANDSARHRFVKMHEGFSRIEKLERQRKWLIGGLIALGVLSGYQVLLTL